MTQEMQRLFLSPPHMGGRESFYIQKAFESGYIAPLGPLVDAFERDFSQYTGFPHCLAVSSGTAALHLALRCLGVGAGDCVICPTLTFIGGVTPVLYQGAVPYFMDVDPKTWTLDCDLLEETLSDLAKQSKRPKAVVPADLYGQACDGDRLREICDRFGVFLVMDSAESVGSRYKGKHAGVLGDMAAFSFNGNKIITTSGGGMLASSNQQWIEEARFLSQQARDPAPHYQHTTYGYNYRMSNIVAAIGCGQLEVIEERVFRRRWVFEQYQKHLQVFPEISFMPEAAYGKSNRWLTVILLDQREALRQALEKENIEARPVWKPMHLQPVFKGYPMRGGEVSQALFERGLCLPSGSQMTEHDIERVCEVISTFLTRA